MSKNSNKSNKIVGFFTQDVMYKIISVIAAIIVWMLIINIDDPVMDKKFNIDVEITNIDVLSSVNKVYEIESGDVAVVRVKGRKSVLDKIKSSDITATADLSELSSVNAVSIKPAIADKFVEDVTLSCSTVLKVNLEEMLKNQFQVQVETKGTLEDGYALGECIAKPNMVEVSGGKSVIEKIATLKVIVDVNKVSKSFSTKQDVAAYDEAGNIIESNTLSFSSEKIKVKCNVFETKRIPVSVSVTGNVADGYEFITASALPESIHVYGSDSALETISEITIPVNIDGMKDDDSQLEQNVAIQEYLPQGVVALSDYSMISVQIVIEKKVDLDVSINAGDVTFANVPDGCKAKMITDENSRVDITLNGIESIMDEVSIDDLNIYLDCSDLADGTYEQEVVCGDTGVNVKTSTKIKFKITGGSSTTTETTTTTATPKPTTAAEEDDSEDDDTTEETATPKPTEKPTEEPVKTPENIVEQEVVE